MATKHLYLLCEGEKDEMFYERLAERITGLTFIPDAEFRYRSGANWKTVMATARLLLSRMKYLSDQQEIAIIIAVDNDRNLGHPGSLALSRSIPESEAKKKTPRYSELKGIVSAALGSDPNQWPINVALAIPVEMVESWLLPLMDPNCPELPIYARANQKTAIDYYGGKPPLQLKDLRDEQAKHLGLTQDELFWKAANEGDLDLLAACSKSFALFKAEFDFWK